MTFSSVCQSRFARLTVVFAAAVGVVSGAGAAGNAVPVAITIDAEHLIELYQSVPDLKIIDSRHREDHRQGYIEQSYSLPLDDTDCAALGKLARDKDQALVFYCNGNPGGESIGAISIASSCGYRRLFWLRGGFVEWEDKDYPFVIE